MKTVHLFVYSIQILGFILIEIPDTASNLVLPIGRIAGGGSIDICQAKFAVQVITHSRCGGSLITPLHVVTAAHCVNTTIPSHITVIGGATYFGKGGIRRSVDRIILPKNTELDLAVLRLSSELRGPNIGTIELCDTQWHKNDSFQVYGWGNIREKSVTCPVCDISHKHPRLQVVEVPFVDYEICTLRLDLELSNSVFCAGVPGKKDSCRGDSGGPAVFNNQLCGVVSFGGHCPDIGVYVNINNVKAFIEKALKLDRSLPDL